MKYFKSFILIFIIVLIATSCNKDEESTADYIKATINGEAFSSTFDQLIITNSFEPPYKLVDFYGSNVKEDAIRITLSSYLEPNTYNMPDVNHPLLGFEYQPTNGTEIWVASTNHSGTTGVLTITEENETQIKGTFAFSAFNTNDATTVQVTNGQFLLTK